MLTRLPSVTLAPLQQGNKPWAATQDADADGCLDCELLNTMTKANKLNKAQKNGRGSYEPRPWAMIYSS